MKTGRNRLGRQDHSRLWARHRRGPAAACRWAAPLLVAATLALRRRPRHRPRPGGASTVAASDAQAGSGIAFAPMRWAGATWYGPGFYGSHTACGQVLRPGHDRRRPPQPALWHHGQVRLPRALDRHPGDRPRPLQPRQLLGPDQRRPRSASTSKAPGQIRYAVSLQYARQLRTQRSGSLTAAVTASLLRLSRTFL